MLANFFEYRNTLGPTHFHSPLLSGRALAIIFSVLGELGPERRSPDAYLVLIALR